MEWDSNFPSVTTEPKRAEYQSNDLPMAEEFNWMHDEAAQMAEEMLGDTVFTLGSDDEDPAARSLNEALESNLSHLLSDGVYDWHAAAIAEEENDFQEDLNEASSVSNSMYTNNYLLPQLSGRAHSKEGAPLNEEEEGWSPYRNRQVRPSFSSSVQLSYSI